LARLGRALRVPGLSRPEGADLERRPT